MARSRGRICRSKQQHESERAALEAAARMVQRGKEGALTMLAYQCPDCKQWHLGHPAEDIQRMMRKRMAWRLHGKPENKVIKLTK